MSTQPNKETRAMREITKEWDNLMHLVERLKFGELRIVIQHGKPVRVEQVVNQVKLDGDEDFKKGLDTIPLL